MHILDQALEPYDSDEIEFAFDRDELYPPHPFAQLLRRAFAPQLDPTLLLISTLAAGVGDNDWPPEFNTAQNEWHRAIMRFADRFGLWRPEPSWTIRPADDVALAVRH